MDSRIDPSWMEVLTDPVRLDVLLALSTAGGGTAGEIAAECHATEPTVKRHLNAFVALGLAREARAVGDGEKPGRPPTRFILDARIRRRAEELFAVLRQPLSPSHRRTEQQRQPR